MVGPCAVHLAAAASAPEVSAADNKTYLHAEIGAVLDRPANFINRFKVNAFSVLTGKNLSAELEKDPLIYILHFLMTVLSGTQEAEIGF